MSEPTPAIDQTRDAPTAHEERLAELADEFVRRHRAGERPAVDEYAHNHPDLAGQIRALFPAMLMMEQSGPAQTAGAGTPTERLGSTVGRYKLLEQLGEGGMGSVFLAEQTHPVRRQVALKIIKPGMDSRQVIARFEAERQALALMDHPNIAKVYDVGMTETGRPYFVMELVRGSPITKYCDDRHLGPRERLELFIQVCLGVQHAHQKGIIHRDLKPSNVLVALYDGKPVPKVIDFGVAKAAGPRLTERTMFTGFGDVVGTLEYMSPEQAELNQLDIDTRSDIYSLGVLLYELLTGTTPIDHKRVKEAALLEVLRVIREEEPPKPSTRLGTTEQLPSIAANRGLEPRKLSGLVHGELDWIVMKALEKERTRRYETATGLARDVERYLQDEPVHACPPSATYRFRKFARRNRTALLAASAGLAALLALVVGLAVSNRFIATERDRKDAALKGEQEALVLARHKSEEAARNLVTAQANERATREALYAARINLAQQAAASADVDRMLELLNSLRPGADQEDLRGFEWYYLWRLCHSESQTFEEFSAPVRSAAFSPDGKLLATSHGAEVKLWDPGRHELLATLRAADRIRSLAFSPDGTLLAVGGGAVQGRGEVQVWNVATKKQILPLPPFDEPVSAVAFSPDGKSLGTATAAFITGHTTIRDRDLALTVGSKPQRVKLWDLSSAKLIGPCEGASESVLSIAFSPDGAFLAAGTYDGQVISWQCSTLRKERSRPGNAGYVSAIAFSPDGTTLAAGSGNWINPGQVILWSFPSMESGRAVRGHRGGVTSLVFSPDGKQIATGSYDRTVCVWTVARGELVNRFVGHRQFVSSVAFAPDGRTLASSSWDNSVRLWDIGNGFSGLRPVANGGTSAAFLPDGRAVTNSNPVLVIDRAAATTRPVETMVSDGRVAIAPNGRLIAAGDISGNLIVWDSSSLSRVHAFQDDQKKIWSVSFSPDGRTLASAGQNDKVTLRDVATGRVLREIKPQGTRARSVAFSPDGLTLATATWEGAGSVQIWDVRSVEPPRTLEGRGATSVAFSPDGRLFAAARQNLVWLYDARTWTVLHTITGHGDDVWEVAFSPDSKAVASASWDATLRLWSVSNAQLMLTFQSNLPLFGVAFSPDGRTLAATGSGIRFWDAANPADADEHIDGVRHRSDALRRLGRLSEAEQFLRATLRTYGRRFGDDHVWTARVMVDLASVLIERADPAAYPEAESTLIKARSMLGQKLIPGHPWRWAALYAARDLYGPRAMNDPAKLAQVNAAASYQPTTAPVAATNPATGATPTDKSLDALNRQAYVLRRDNRLEEARALRAQVVESAKALYVAGDVRLVKYQDDYVTLLMHMKRYEEAEAVAREALASLPAAEETSRQKVLNSLVTLYEQWEKLPQAEHYRKMLTPTSAPAATQPAKALVN